MLRLCNMSKLSGMLSVALLFVGYGRTNAEFQLPAGNVQMKIQNVDTILGAPGTPGDGSNTALTHQSTVSDEAISYFQPSSFAIKGVPGNIANDGTLNGMIGDLALIGHTNSSGVAYSPSDIAPGAGLTTHANDFLFFGELGRNPINAATGFTKANLSGGYFMLSQTSTALAAPDITGNLNNISLGSGGFTVGTDGVVTGTADNYTVGGTNVIDPNNVLLAGTFLPLASLTTITPPGGVSFPAFAPAGTVFVEEVNSSNTGTVGMGFLQVLGGSEAGVIAPNQTFTSTNTVSGGALGGSADLSLAVTSTFSTSPTNLQWAATSNDPVNYVGVPEPASSVLFGLGMAGLAVFGKRRRNRLSNAKA